MQEVIFIFFSSLNFPKFYIFISIIYNIVSLTYHQICMFKMKIHPFCCCAIAGAFPTLKRICAVENDTAHGVTIKGTGRQQFVRPKLSWRFKMPSRSGQLHCRLAGVTTRWGITENEPLPLKEGKRMASGHSRRCH